MYQNSLSAILTSTLLNVASIRWRIIWIKNCEKTALQEGEQSCASLLLCSDVRLPLALSSFREKSGGKRLIWNENSYYAVRDWSKIISWCHLILKQKDFDTRAQGQDSTAVKSMAWKSGCLHLRILALTLTSSGFEALNLLKPSFPHLQKGDHNKIFLTGCGTVI